MDMNSHHVIGQSWPRSELAMDLTVPATDRAVQGKEVEHRLTDMHATPRPLLAPNHGSCLNFVKKIEGSALKGFACTKQHHRSSSLSSSWNENNSS